MPSFVVVESLNSVRVFWLQQEKLIEEIRKLAQRIGAENPDVKEVVLFGSLAQKRGVPGSDADLLIVLWKDDRPFPERIGAWLAKFDLDFPVEVFPYTVDELDNPLAQEALSSGMRLYTAIAPKISVDRDDRVLLELKAVLKGFLGERVALILYGSRARGDYAIESDIDIAIIVQDLTRELKHQILNMVADIELTYLTPLSTLVLSSEDFEFLKKRERRIALDIEREGIPL